ncbi:MAG: glycosyltransferase family 2 protein [Romboutsia sp.]
MLVSLIMPTLNRYDDIELLIQSLKVQTYKEFELIVVDQNENNKVKAITNKYINDIDIKYIKSDKKGLSYNRNIGLDTAKGQIIAFPDDDCEYKVDTLEKVINFFNNTKEYRIYSCKTLEKGKDYGFGRMLDNNSEITSLSVFDTVKSITFFVNYKNDDYLKFDENLGVGAKFGSGEESDYVLDLLDKGYKGKYFADDVVYHPAKKEGKSKEKYNRDYNYGRGFGALCKKQIIHRKDYKFSSVMTKKIIRNLGGLLMGSDKDYHKATIKGRIQGFMQYKK